MRLRMVVGFNDVEEAVSMSAATSEAKQRSSVSMSFQVLACGDETAGARDVGSHIALACLKDDPDTKTSSWDPRLDLGVDPATLCPLDVMELDPTLRLCHTVSC